MAEGKPEVQSDLSTGLLAVGESRRAVMAGATRYDNPQSSMPFNVAIAEKGTAFYGNRQPIP